jgi:hypothetical protein
MKELMMSVIVQFPNISKAILGKGEGVTSHGQLVARIVWTVAVMVWPLLRWVIALDVTLQLFRVLIVSVSRGWYLDWSLTAHFAVFVAATYFVLVYRPT